MSNKKIRLAGSMIGALIAAGGELYFHSQRREDIAFTFLFLGLLAIVVIDKVIELFGRDSEDVFEELQQLPQRMGLDVIEQGTLKVLDRLRNKPIHHYHLTMDQYGQPMWSYKVLRFDQPPSAGKLLSNAFFLPNSKAKKKHNEYQIEASLERSHLIIKMRRKDGSPDMSIEVFRDFSGRSTASAFPVYGVNILTTWSQDRLASSISIISDCALVPGAADGVPMTKIGTLQSDWEKYSGIARLPTQQPRMPSPVLPSVELKKQGVTIEQKWNEDRVLELLQSSSLNADIRIFVTFFVTDIDLFEILGRLLTNSKRTITIMMLDPDSPVLEMRYGTETRKIRESITATTARARITSQLRDLMEIVKMLKRRASDAARDKTQPDFGTLTVRKYDCPPTLVSYCTQEKMLVGMLLLHKSANAGPMIQVQKGEPLWDLIEENWRTVLSVSKTVLPDENAEELRSVTSAQ